MKSRCATTNGLKVRLERAGIEATPYNIALAWNAGLTAVLNDHVPASSHDYADRVSNLAMELRARQLASLEHGSN